MSATLDDLIKMEGVVMAFEFTPDGQCTAQRNVTPEMAAMTARYCTTVTMEFNTLARAFSTLSEQEWVPQQGWMYQGGDHTVIVGNGGYRVVFVEAAKADLKELLNALFDSKQLSAARR
jgi:roadblock/LC7 domain-containing protein